MATPVQRPAAVGAAPVRSPSALSVTFLVPDFTTGAVATRAARTAAARAPHFDVTLNEHAPSLHRVLPRLGWTDAAATGSGTFLHALVVALGPILAPSGPFNLCDGYFDVSVMQRALRALEDADDFVFPSSSCHVVFFWRLLSSWLVGNACVVVQPADWIVLDPIAPRLAHPHSFVHDLSADLFVSRGGGSLALWSLFTALVGPLGVPLRRMDLTSTFMAVCNRIGRGILVDSSSEAAQLVGEGYTASRVMRITR